MKLQLNGWQRIGIVVSVLWSLLVIGTSVDKYVEHLQWTKQIAQTEARIKECRTNAMKEINPQKRQILERRCGFSSAEIGMGVPKPNFVEVLAFLFFPIIGVWAVAYFLVWVTKWVITGFKAH